MSLSQTEYFQLICADAIIPRQSEIDMFVDSMEIIVYWDNNQQLPKSLIELKLIDDIGFTTISDSKKEELLKQLKYYLILQAAHEEKEADLSFIVNGKLDELVPLGDLIDELLDEVAETIPTGIHALDNALGGGVLEQSYNLILAETNIGKTALMLNLAMNYMRQNKKVIYLTFEETRSAILSRLMQNILRIKMGDIRKVNEFQKQTVKKILDNIIVISRPSGDISVDDFFKLIKSQSYEACFVDYFVHFKKNPKNDVLEELKTISAKLSNHAKQNDKIVWSASQARRESYGKIPTLADAGASIEAVRLADLVVAATKGETVCDETTNKYQIKMNILKDRQAANRTIPVELMLNVHYQQIEECDVVFSQPTQNKPEQKQSKKRFVMDAEDETKEVTLKMFKNRGI